MAEAPLHEDAPLEIQQAILAVNRGAASLRVQYGERIELLMNSLVQHKSAMDRAAIVSEIDADGRIAVVNDQFVENTGLSREAVVGQHLESLTIAGPAPAWAPGQAVWQGDVEIAGHGRTPQWHRTIVPMFDAGIVERYSCIDIDITERKAFERTILATARRENLIAELGRMALTATDLDLLFHEAAEAASIGLDASSAALFALEPDSGVPTLVIRATHGALALATGFALDCPPGTMPPQVPADRLRPLFAPLGAACNAGSCLNSS